MYILSLLASPRKNGNSELLLNYFLSFLKDFKIEKIKLSELRFSPCQECGACEISGLCKLKDDFHLLYPKLEMVDLLVVSAPVFFYNHPSCLQAFYERLQPFWVRRKKFGWTRKKQLWGVLLSVGARKDHRMFTGIKRSFKCALLVLGGRYLGGIFVKEVEKPGDVLKRPKVLSETMKLARKVKKTFKKVQI